MNSRVVGRLVLGVLLVLPLAACTSQDPPEPRPVDTPTPTASSSPTPTESPEAAPTLPPEARGTTKKSAEAFVRYAVDVLNYSGQTLDTNPLRRISATRCAACHSIIKNLDRIRRAGGSIIGGEWLPIEAIVLASAEPGIQVQVVIQSSAQEVRIKAGAKATRFKPGKTLYLFSVTRRGGSPLLTGVRQL